jgi:hypothetical protein
MGSVTVKDLRISSFRQGAMHDLPAASAVQHLRRRRDDHAPPTIPRVRSRQHAPIVTTRFAVADYVLRDSTNAGRCDC